MSTRTTSGHLESQIRQLNIALGLPLEPYRQREDGKGCAANIGNLHLDHNIGGWQVQQIINESGGVTCPLGDYRFTAGEMWHCLRAALGGVRLANDRADARRAA